MKASDFQLKPQTSASPVHRAFFDRNPEAAFFPQQQRQSDPFFNPAVQSARTPIQAKMTVGAAGDRYEQEADRVAQAVVQRMNQPERGQLDVNQETLTQSDQPLQRETLHDDDELQMKPLLQREVDPEEEDELQMKPDLQRQGGGAVAASDELETSIQQSRGGGQPLADSIRAPMEQAFGGVDFSGVKVHTDGKSDQLNQSIQAKAFTTGQDVFFRQGAYQPGSRGGQELIAHELTHVVQQGSPNQYERTEMQVQRWPGITSDSGTFQYQLGVGFQSRHIAATQAAAELLARGLYDPWHRNPHNAAITVIYGNSLQQVNQGDDVAPRDPYEFAITVDVTAVMMGPSGRSGVNGDPGTMDRDITSVILSGYIQPDNTGLITHVSASQ